MGFAVTVLIPRAAVLLSGGLDSVLCLHMCVEKHGALDVLAVSVDYEQPHVAELEHAKRWAKKLGVSHRIITVRGAYTESSSGLFRGDVDNAADTVVPCRNMLLLALAGASGAGHLVLGCNLDDWHDYVDCRPHVLKLSERLMDARVSLPLAGMTKAQVVDRARGYGIPIEETLSCYRGTNCGVCAACVLRNASQ